uniref:Ovule protein n=1 Tax=Strongyloides papillosus TaxID=174720 RepID=A0A0N5C1R5_STREA
MRYYCTPKNSKAPCYLQMNPRDFYYKNYFKKSLCLVDRRWIWETWSKTRHNHRFLDVLNSYLRLAIPEFTMVSLITHFFLLLTQIKFLTKLKVNYKSPTYLSFYVESGPHVYFKNNGNSEPSVFLHHRKGHRGM